MDMRAPPIGQPCHHCPICRRPFQWKSYLKRHLATHTEARPHVCLKCNKDFKRSDQLAGHMIHIHNEIPPTQMPFSNWLQQVSPDHAAQNTGENKNV